MFLTRGGVAICKLFYVCARKERIHKYSRDNTSQCPTAVRKKLEMLKWSRLK